MAIKYTFQEISRGSSKSTIRVAPGLWSGLPFVVCAILVASGLRAAEEPNLFQLLRAEKQIEVPGEDGWNEPYLLPVREIAVGEEVIYTVEFGNDGGTEVEQPVIICP